MHLKINTSSFAEIIQLMSWIALLPQKCKSHINILFKMEFRMISVQTCTEGNQRVHSIAEIWH